MPTLKQCAVFLLITLMWYHTASGLRAGETANAEVKFNGEIVVGATFPLTGRFETYGQSAYYGATTSVKLINERGGINGRKLTLEWRDNGSVASQAAQDIRELVATYKSPVILGPLLSEGTMAARNVADELGVVIMTPLATINEATAGTPWIFRACFNNTAEANGLITFQMRNYGAKSCGILYDSSSSFSNELAGIFEDMFRERGGTVVGSHSIYDANGDKDYETPLKALASENPDFIFAPCYALEATEIIHAARDLQISIRFCGSDTWDNELVFNAAGSRLAGTSFASSLFERAFSYRPFQIFFTAMEQAGMDNPDAQAACAYDAVSLLAWALERGDTPDAVREALLTVKRLPLATGRITISPEGDAIKPVIIRVVERHPSGLIPVYAERYDP